CRLQSRLYTCRLHCTEKICVRQGLYEQAVQSRLFTRPRRIQMGENTPRVRTEGCGISQSLVHNREAIRKIHLAGQERGAMHRLSALAPHSLECVLVEVGLRNG